jgi:hypothetical protein
MDAAGSSKTLVELPTTNFAFDLDDGLRWGVR